MLRRFRQLDVFTAVPYRGNPLAVVIDGDGLSGAEMREFATWTNLSETTFLRTPSDPAADYALRIFTTTMELPFAGHPTIGSCKAWLEAGGVPKTPGVVVQECGVGLVTLRLGDGGRAAFGAPPVRIEPIDEARIETMCGALGIGRDAVLDAAVLTNGPVFPTLLLDSASRVLAVTPDHSVLTREHLDIGLVGLHPAGSECQAEVRLLMGTVGSGEDPVTGSLNASIAQWLMGTGVLPDRYTAAQGTAIGRAGRVYLERDTATDPAGVWVGGDAVTCIEGTVSR